MWFPCKHRAGRALLGACLAAFTAGAGAFSVEEQVVARADWPAYANGTAVSALPGVRRTLHLFEENGNFQVIIRYPGGDYGRQWAEELLGWLVSFGIPPAYLELQPGAGGTDRLVLEVIDRG